MADTTFVQNTPITVEWLNEVNDAVWKDFDGSATDVAKGKLTIASGFIGVSGDFYQSTGIASVTDVGTGVAQVNFTPNLFIDSAYAVVVTPVATGVSLVINVPGTTKLPGSFRIECLDANTLAPTDPTSGYSFIAIGRAP